MSLGPRAPRECFASSCTTAEPRLRVALEKVAEGQTEGAEVTEALAELEAQAVEAARAAKLAAPRMPFDRNS